MADRYEPESALPRWQTGSVQVTDGHLAFHRTGGHRTGGAGKTLVLSHGLTDNGLCWRRLATVLAADFDVIMLDARGHGASSRMVQGKRYDPAHDIAEAIEQLGLSSPVVMGHSVGARATASYANAHSDRVSQVILEDPPFLPLADASRAVVRQQRFREQIEKFQSMSDLEIAALGKSTSPKWHEDEFPDWVRAKKQVDPHALPDYRIPWQQTLAQITAPTLLIHGDADLGSLVTAEIIAEVRSINPIIQTALIRGAGHNTRRENFPDFVAAVCDFLACGEKSWR